MRTSVIRESGGPSAEPLPGQFWKVRAQFGRPLKGLSL